MCPGDHAWGSTTLTALRCPHLLPAFVPNTPGFEHGGSGPLLGSLTDAAFSQDPTLSLAHQSIGLEETLFQDSFLHKGVFKSPPYPKVMLMDDRRTSRDEDKGQVEPLEMGSCIIDGDKIGEQM
ncbi:hypothetical protein BTVI_72490 [Pitangus sulphuratus]|nr:hypothetical protein BTVI_72490 [Pitangus sulphuratus]